MWKLLSVQQKHEAITLLRERGLLQKEVAEKLGCTSDTIYRFCQYWGLSPFPIGGREGNTNAFKGGNNKKYETKLAKEAVVNSGRSLLICERCDFKGVEELTCHHKDKDRKNSDNDNIEVLCPNCHAELHIKERQRDPITGRLL